MKKFIGKLKVIWIKIKTIFKETFSKDGFKNFGKATIRFFKKIGHAFVVAGQLIWAEIKARAIDLKDKIKESWAEYKAELKEAITKALADALEKITEIEDIITSDDVIEDIE